MKLQKKYLVGAGAALLLALVAYRIANHKDDDADAQALTLFTTPVVYLYLDRFGAWLRGETRESARRPVPLKQTAA